MRISLTPFDPDNITETPHFLTYVHQRGNLPIKLTEQGKLICNLAIYYFSNTLESL
jgi:hypothetical protein